MNNLDRHLTRNDIHPVWLLIPGALWAVIIIWWKLSGGEPESMPREAHVPACWQVQGMNPTYCEMRVKGR